MILSVDAVILEALVIDDFIGLNMELRTGDGVVSLVVNGNQLVNPGQLGKLDELA